LTIELTPRRSQLMILPPCAQLAGITGRSSTRLF